MQNMELSNSLNNLVSSKHNWQSQAVNFKDFNVVKDIASQSEDSGYHSLKNAEQFYASNANSYKGPVQEETMKTIEFNREKSFIAPDSTFSTYASLNAISESAAYTAPSAVTTQAYHSHKAAKLDDNANHIHHFPEKQADTRCTNKAKDSGIACSCDACLCSNCFQTKLVKKQYSHHESDCCCSSGNISHQLDPVNKCSNNESSSDAVDLAEKIEFCLLFGYTANQIHFVISKLGYKASKNDILAELSQLQNVSTSATSSNGLLVSSSQSCENIQHKMNELISHGAEADSSSSLTPSTVTSLMALEEGLKSDDGRNMSDDSENLRPIVIDGSNVAMSHGNKQHFSCKGILLAVNYFRNRNHRDITVFVPIYRKESSRHDTPIKDREILTQLEDERILVFTPSRNINGKRVTCYDDRFILKLAFETDGIIVSNDNFRDLQNEKPEWKELVEKRLLMYSFVADRFMPPDDPLGRNGPSIDNFLRIRPAAEEKSKPLCPYGKKCTYGKKCKYFHPECSRPKSLWEVGKNTDNGRRRSNFSTALALKIIQQQIQPAAVRSSNYQEPSMINSLPPTSYICANTSPNKLMQMDADHPLKHRADSSSRSDGVYPPRNPPMQHYMAHDGVDQRSNNAGNSLSKSLMHLSLADQRKHPEPCSAQPNIHVPEYHSDHFLPPRNLPQSARCSMPQSQPLAGAPNPPVFHPSQWNIGAYPQAIPRVHPPPPPHQIIYQRNYVDQQFPVNHPLYSFPVSPPSLPRLHANFTAASAYPGSVNTSVSSNNSLPHSFPYMSATDRLHASQNISSTSSHSDPHGYHLRASMFPPKHNVSSPSLSRAMHYQVLPNAGSTSTEVPLNSNKHPRFYLYRNLCGLYPRHIVETVMKSHPDVADPVQIIKLIKKFAD